MDGRALKKRLIRGLGWSAGIAVVAGAIAAGVNLAISYGQGYLQEGGPLAYGGTLMVILSTALFVFPVALLFFWIKAFLTYNKDKSNRSEEQK